jgi:hypothetical protein
MTKLEQLIKLRDQKQEFIALLERECGDLTGEISKLLKVEQDKSTGKALSKVYMKKSGKFPEITTEEKFFLDVCGMNLFGDTDFAGPDSEYGYSGGINKEFYEAAAKEGFDKAAVTRLYKSLLKKGVMDESGLEEINPRTEQPFKNQTLYSFSLDTFKHYKIKNCFYPKSNHMVVDRKKA